MIRRLSLAAALVALAALSPLAAHEYQRGDLRIDHPYARATAAQNGAAYLTIENKGATGDRLVGAASPAAGKVELHTIIREGDVMKMRQVPAIELAPGGRTELKPGGFHIMLLGLAKPLREGERFPLTLDFEKAGKLDVDVVIDKAGAGGHMHGATPPAKAP